MSRTLILATVIAIRDHSFYYPYCIICYKKVILNINSRRWQCFYCNVGVEENKVPYRYRLALTIADEEFICPITIFGRCLETFFGMPANEFQRYICHIENDDIQGFDTFSIKKLIFSAIKDILVGSMFLFGLTLPEGLFRKLIPNFHKLSCIWNAIIRKTPNDNSLICSQMINPLPQNNKISVIDILNKHLTIKEFEKKPSAFISTLADHSHNCDGSKSDDYFSDSSTLLPDLSDDFFTQNKSTCDSTGLCEKTLVDLSESGDSHLVVENKGTNSEGTAPNSITGNYKNDSFSNVKFQNSNNSQSGRLKLITMSKEQNLSIPESDPISIGSQNNLTILDYSFKKDSSTENIGVHFPNTSFKDQIKPLSKVTDCLCTHSKETAMICDPNEIFQSNNITFDSASLSCGYMKTNYFNIDFKNPELHDYLSLSLSENNIPFSEKSTLCDGQLSSIIANDIETDPPYSEDLDVFLNKIQEKITYSQALTLQTREINNKKLLNNSNSTNSLVFEKQTLECGHGFKKLKLMKVDELKNVINNPNESSQILEMDNVPINPFHNCRDLMRSIGNKSSKDFNPSSFGEPVLKLSSESSYESRGNKNSTLENSSYTGIQNESIPKFYSDEYNNSCDLFSDISKNDSAENVSHSSSCNASSEYLSTVTYKELLMNTTTSTLKVGNISDNTQSISKRRKSILSFNFECAASSENITNDGKIGGNNSFYSQDLFESSQTSSCPIPKTFFSCSTPLSISRKESTQQMSPLLFSQAFDQSGSQKYTYSQKNMDYSVDLFCENLETSEQSQRNSLMYSMDLFSSQ